MKQLLLFFTLLSTVVFGKQQVIPVVVIGSGPAGLSAAMITGREQIETHIFTGQKFGGPVNANTCLGNWPGSVPGKGDDVMTRLIEQVSRFPVTTHDQEIVSIDLSSEPYQLTDSRGQTHHVRAIVVATGPHPKTLGLPGEELAHSYVYKKDANSFKGKTVLVVGGGLDASKKATIVSNTADKVYVAIRQKEMQKPFFEKRLTLKGRGNIELLRETTVEEIHTRNGQITSVKLKGPSVSGELKVDALVLAIGIAPSTELVASHLELDEGGYITLTGRTQQTSVPGVFAAGNATDPRYRQAATSSGDGVKAGYDAIAYLHEHNR